MPIVSLSFLWLPFGMRKRLKNLFSMIFLWASMHYLSEYECVHWLVVTASKLWVTIWWGNVTSSGSSPILLLRVNSLFIQRLQYNAQNLVPNLLYLCHSISVNCRKNSNTVQNKRNIRNEKNSEAFNRVEIEI